MELDQSQIKKLGRIFLERFQRPEETKEFCEKYNIGMISVPMCGDIMMWQEEHERVRTYFCAVRSKDHSLVFDRFWLLVPKDLAVKILFLGGLPS